MLAVLGARGTSPPGLAAIPRSLLGQPVANLDDRHTEVMAALDMVLIGF